MTRYLYFLLFLALQLRGLASTDASADASISKFAGTYFTSWSNGDFVGYRSCFHPSATVTYEDQGQWRSWELKRFLNDQENAQSQLQFRSEEVPLAVHTKALQGDMAFVEVPWRLKPRSTGNEITGVDWWTLVRNGQSWKILNLTFWSDPPEKKAGADLKSNDSTVKRRQKIIVSGFEKFAGRPINASSELAEAIAHAFPNFDITFVLVPVVWGAPEKAIEKYREAKPALWIAFGEGNKTFQVETTGRNQRAELQDNLNQMPNAKKNSSDGPEQFHITFSATGLSQDIQNKGYNCTVSTNAGGYLCEEMLYSLLKEQQSPDSTLKQVAFIHVPVYGSTVLIHGEKARFEGDNLKTAAFDVFQALATFFQIGNHQ